MTQTSTCTSTEGPEWLSGPMNFTMGSILALLLWTPSLLGRTEQLPCRLLGSPHQELSIRPRTTFLQFWGKIQTELGQSTYMTWLMKIQELSIFQESFSMFALQTLDMAAMESNNAARGATTATKDQETAAAENARLTAAGNVLSKGKTAWGRHAEMVILMTGRTAMTGTT